MPSEDFKKLTAWFCKNIDETYIGDATKNSCEGVGSTISKLLEKATEQDMLALDHYTIPQSAESMLVKSDIDEPYLDNRLKYLHGCHMFSQSVSYGHHHPQEVKLFFADYIFIQIAKQRQ